MLRLILAAISKSVTLILHIAIKSSPGLNQITDKSWALPVIPRILSKSGPTYEQYTCSSIYQNFPFAKFCACIQAHKSWFFITCRECLCCMCTRGSAVQFSGWKLCVGDMEPQESSSVRLSVPHHTVPVYTACTLVHHAHAKLTGARGTGREQALSPAS